jgi:hypothetical protein
MAPEGSTTICLIAALPLVLDRLKEPQGLLVIRIEAAPVSPRSLRLLEAAEVRPANVLHRAEDTQSRPCQRC